MKDDNGMIIAVLTMMIAMRAAVFKGSSRDQNQQAWRGVCGWAAAPAVP